MTLTESEKNLLTIIGKNPSLPRSELQCELKYKRASTLSIKMNDLEKAGYIKGPYYHINLTGVGKNPIYSTFTEVRFDPEEYSLVSRLISGIDCWEWIFPTIQGDALFALFRSNSYVYLSRLLNMLKKEDLIEYRSYSSQNRWLVHNPDFFGGTVPHVSGLLEETDNDFAYPKIQRHMGWRFIDLKVMQYLQVKTCSISEIQKMEKQVEGIFWRRKKIKYSIEKIIKTGIAERKHYNISPYPRDECYAFLLLVEGDRRDVLPFVSNFGKGCRMYKTCTVCDDIGFVWCWTSPQLGPSLMKTLDSLRPRIFARCLQLKSVGHKDTVKKSFNEEHFDFETQRWVFPFKKYEEKIEKELEKRKR